MRANGAPDCFMFNYSCCVFELLRTGVGPTSHSGASRAAQVALAENRGRFAYDQSSEQLQFAGGSRALCQNQRECQGLRWQ